MIKFFRGAPESPAEYRFSSPYGPMRILASARGISALEFTDRPDLTDSADIPEPVCRAIDLINRGIRPQEPLTLLLDRSDFRFAVLNTLLSIPPGQTATYSQVAAAIGRPKAVRAVASAIARNPIALLIPCHRVVPAAGGTGRYRWGAELKRAILQSERLKTLSGHSALWCD